MEEGGASGEGIAEGAEAESESDEDSTVIDDLEAACVTRPAASASPSAALKTAAEVEAEFKAKKAKTAKKDKKETAASVLCEYLQSKTADKGAGVAGPEARATAGSSLPGEASLGEVRLAVVNLLNAFAEKARGHVRRSICLVVA
ncbi:hypothetical protein I4F81_008631 [Pyropia yezoensis]|uniref:Uncharacterized protein n=1 Tax=Pyropia yezoensis TaxID=2788 RepID=A0ACC3C815_PYRYE|nr:hypothetical protein I4F81_008631 [Neopyropia yezoensis]